MHVVSRSLQLVLMSLCGPICSATAITYAAWSLLGRGRFFYVSEVVPTSHWSILSTSIEPAKKQTWFRLNLVCFAPMQDGATLLAQYMTKGIYSLHPSLYPTYLLYRWSFENYRIRFRTLAMKDKHCIFGGDRWYSLPIKLDSRNAPFTCNSNKTARRAQTLSTGHKNIQTKVYSSQQYDASPQRNIINLKAMSHPVKRTIKL